MTAGAASPLLAAGIGAMSGAASGALDGGAKGALMGGLMGGATGGLIPGGPAVNQTFGTAAKEALKKTALNSALTLGGR
jgi:hypothetical protein